MLHFALHHLLHYEASLERNFDCSLTLLERLQRIRKGQAVPGTVTPSLGFVIGTQGLLRFDDAQSSNLRKMAFVERSDLTAALHGGCANN